jgi:hypothetical protein
MVIRAYHTMYESAAKRVCHRSGAAFAARYKIDGKLRALGVSAVRVCSEVMDAMDAE